MKEIIPAILSLNKENFYKKLDLLSGISKKIHIDVSDGIFTPYKTYNDFLYDEKFKNYKNDYEFHLMVSEASDYLSQLNDAGFIGDKIYIHAEIPNLFEIIKSHSNFADISIAFRPDAAISSIAKLITDTDLSEILIVSVEPGKQRQKILDEPIQTSKIIKKEFKNTVVGIDGGINAHSILKNELYWLDRYVVGSGISKAYDPQNEYDKIKHLLENA